MGLSTTYTKTETDYLLQKLESELASGLKGTLTISDTAPTIQGLYILSDVGTYTNLGGLVTTTGKVNYAFFDGTIWKLIAVDLPNNVELPLYSVIKNSPISGGIQFINDEEDDKIYRVINGVTLESNQLPKDYIGLKVELVTNNINTSSLIYKIRTENLVNPEKCIPKFYNNKTDFLNGVLTSDDFFAITEKIPVIAGKTYRRTITDNSLYVMLYDLAGEPLDMYGGGGITPIPTDFTIQPNVGFIQLTFVMSQKPFPMLTELGVETGSYIPYYKYQLHDKISVDTDNVKNVLEVKTYNQSDIGFVDYQEIDSTDYSQIIVYGQSLSMGWEAPEAITTTNIDGNYMIGDKPFINHGNNGQNVLNPLVSTMADNCGENPIVSATNVFSKLYRRFKSNQDFIATSCGEGGQTIERLSKECTNTESLTTVDNYYNTSFISALNRTKATVNSLGKSVSCSAIIFMQGEYNYISNTGQGMVFNTHSTTDKNTYKALLLQLKNNMQSDIMAIYGQTKKPLFFIYQVAGHYITAKEMAINMAQIEFANENEDVILMNPTYQTPDYNGGHLSTNGYRWYGEHIAKSMFKVMVKGENFNPIYPKSLEVRAKSVKINFEVPCLPLVFDNWTKESINNNGFNLYMNGTEITSFSTEIINNSVILNTNTYLNGEIEVTYAGYGSNGSGNLRDSDEWVSMYRYYDDRTTSPSKQENYTPLDKLGGTKIYGKPYPMYNFCSHFYIKVVN